MLYPSPVSNVSQSDNIEYLSKSKFGFEIPVSNAADVFSAENIDGLIANIRPGVLIHPTGVSGSTDLPTFCNVLKYYGTGSGVC